MELFKKISDRVLPGHFEWHEWTERALKPLVSEGYEYEVAKKGGQKKIIRLAGLPGCAGSAKTFNVTSFACQWWLCEPGESSVMLVSTTMSSLRQRAWAEVIKCYSHQLHPKFGNFVDSRLRWQASKGDDRHCIYGRAVEEGSIQKIADDIKGIHTRRQMVVIDEATRINEAILTACGNLYDYPDEFILVLIGNPLNRLDQFGRFCEPEAGWMSVNVESGSWIAKPFEKCGGAKPMVVTFDAEKSPNIVEGQIVSRHLPKKESVERARVASGGGNTPNYWQNFRGFWPPEGMANTVFTETALIKHGSKDTLKFTGDNFQIIATFDPAFSAGGDRAVLRFAKMGIIESGILGIQALPPIIIPLQADSKNPVRYQLAEQVVRECESVQVGPYVMNCPPENLAVDNTGDGGVLDILHRTWSPKVLGIEYRGTPSDNAISLEDARPASEVFKNKRAEMYFFSRSVMDSGQLKGIDDDTAVELCNMEFMVNNGKTLLMDKKDYRVKFGSSPDLADTLVMLPEIARQRGFMLAALQRTAEVVEKVEEEYKANQDVYDESDEYQPEEMEPVENLL